jgi:hypothetical protein
MNLKFEHVIPLWQYTGSPHGPSLNMLPLFDLVRIRKHKENLQTKKEKLNDYEKE